MPLNDGQNPSLPASPAMVGSSCGCAIINAIAANSVAIKSVMRAGSRRYIMTPVRSGTMSNQGDMLNVDCRALLYISVSFVMPEWWLRLANRKMMSVIAMVGNVV